MPGLSRRTFLLGAGASVVGAGVLGACGGDDGDGAVPATTASGDTAAPVDPEAPVLGATFDRNGLLVTGIPQRAPFVLFEPSGGLLPVEDAPAELLLRIETEDGEEVGSIPVARHGDDVERPYYPLVTSFTDPGLYVVRADLGADTPGFAINVNEPGDVAVPQVGSALPSFASPTTTDPLGVTTLCTREQPCPFHELSVDEVLASGRPLALLVSTPAFCQVAICGPVLDLLIDAAPRHADVAVVHLEVYPNGAPPAAEPSTLVADPLGLAYEPVLFVADGTGAVTARLDNIYDGPELELALTV